MTAEARIAPAAELRLYAHLGGLEFADLAPRTVESAGALVLDHLACAVLGARLPWTLALLATLESAGELAPVGTGTPGAHVLGRPGAVAATTAALLNGTAAHGLDLDDTHLPTMSHPGAVIIPAALAAAEITGADGREFLTAVVAGYEAMGRIAAATGLGFGEKGFHATGQVGPMGAAVAATRLLAGAKGPDGRTGELAGAVGLAASFGGGIKAFTSGPGAVKRLHAGRAAQAGLFAAMLQTNGFAGPSAAVAGKFGFVPTFSTEDAPAYDRLDADLGGRYVVDDVYLKPYAACGAVHGAVAAAADLAPVPAAAVTRVLVGTSRRALAQNRIPDPADVMSAQYSTEYSVALALLGGAGEPLRYLDAGTGRDAAVRDLAARVVLEVDDRAERSYPAVNEARVEVHLSNGTRRTARGAVSAATSGGWAVAEKKFAAVTRDLLPADRRERLASAVAALAHGGAPAACTTSWTTPEGAN